MPSKSKIMQLPDDLRAQLDERLRDSLFRDFEGHEKWLALQGYRIGKTLVQRYSEEHRARIRSMPRRSTVPGSAAQPLTAADQRLECLRLAVAYKPATAEEHVQTAEKLFAWLHQGAARPVVTGAADSSADQAA